MFEVDSKTVKKYLSKNRQKEKADSKAGLPLFQQYQKLLLDGLKDYPNDTRTKIRECFKKEYIHLYRHDKEWLFKHLPDNVSRHVLLKLLIGLLGMMSIV
ncbi:hypothetical protein CIL05_15455 [Virgibacillus profundi]|uniref:Transposon Tn7 transposition protein TnsD C-terminal domain-containing protein n=1 Tax=Virgibacillus profundi TaxID=2024555 RepID=A0A2A2IBM0_9BACI|nr:hypothetical protein CIL05_15455 [Virgibacillus profundi]PXY52852.1 hypothetical protein CIT14_15585 [Virgibacillus profundi]